MEVLQEGLVGATTIGIDDDSSIISQVKPTLQVHTTRPPDHPQPLGEPPTHHLLFLWGFLLLECLLSFLAMNVTPHPIRSPAVVVLLAHTAHEEL